MRKEVDIRRFGKSASNDLYQKEREIKDAEEKVKNQEVVVVRVRGGRQRRRGRQRRGEEGKQRATTQRRPR